MKIWIYLKNLIKFIKKGGLKKGGITYANISQIQYGKCLAEKNILITGGSSGIGFEIAKKCISEGANVIITGKSKEKLEEACKELDVSKCYYLNFDITDINVYEEVIKQVAETFNQKLDCLVNNAGIYIDTSYKQCTIEQYNQIFDTNLKSVYFFTQAILKKFEKLENILMISSETGLIGNDGPYGISKSAMITYTKGLATKLYQEEKSIRVNAIAPGMTITNINNKNYSKEGNLYKQDRLGKRVLLPEEIAEVACFLLNDASKCINGQVIACNDGNII